MKAIINKFIKGPNGRPIIYDFFYDKNTIKSPIVIFCHGYKGFKDWGAWPLLAKTTASSGVAFLKFSRKSQNTPFPNISLLRSCRN